MIASGFGAGLSPVAPGTAGSLLGLAIGSALLWTSPVLLLGVTLLLAFGGMPVISHAVGIPMRPMGHGASGRPISDGASSRPTSDGASGRPTSDGASGSPIIYGASGGPLGQGAVGDHADPAWVVVDEIAGQCLALLALPRPSWGGALLAFALFRLFDITKPGPIGWADRQGGAWGIMADDLIAGFAACLLVGGAHVRFPALV